MRLHSVRIAVSMLATAIATLALPAAAQTYTKTDTHIYEDNLGLWVLGQPKATTNVNTGLVENSVDYDPATALPIRTYKFGKLQQTLVYYGGGNLKSVSDARDTSSFNTTITFSSWKRGLPQRIDYPDTTYKLLSVDDYGLITWVEDENRFRTCYAFDAMGRLSQVQYPQEGTTSTCDATAQNWFAKSRTFEPINSAEYGLAAGHWREFIRTSSSQKYVYYDAMWRPVLTRTFGLGDEANTLSQTVTRYDADGQPVFQSYPTRDAITDFNQTLPGTRTTYDALGRPTRVEQDAESDLGALVTTMTYLANFTTVTNNPRGKTTVTRYRTLDTPSTDWPVYMQHPGGAYTEITRNTFGLPTSLKRRDYYDNISATRTYAYNTAMELCRVVEPETRATLNGYDEAGNLAWSASGLASNSTCNADGDTVAIQARRVDRTYDPRNRIKTLDFPDDRGNTTYTYTADGLPESVVVNNFANNAVYTNYTYNARRLMTSETMDWSSLGSPWSVTYGYNKFGHLLVQGYPGGVNINYAPNALGQATQAGSYATGVKYYPNGAINEFTYGNGIKHSLVQNDRLLPERSSDTYGSTAFLDDTYDYDQNGNVLAITDATSGSRGNRTMEYDDLDRLLTVTSPMYSSTATPGTMTFAYDVLDNITSVRAWNRTLKYCYDDGTNRLTMIRSPWNTSCTTGAATTALAYDVQGNVASKNNTTYEFDFGNRLRSASDGATSTTYVYDAAGRRVRDITGSSRYSLYTQAGQVAYTSDARKRETMNYIYLAGSLVAASRLPTGSSTPIVEYQHTDALGTPVVVTNASRAIVQKSEYEPYGNVINRPKTDGIGFTGHVEDATTGLSYMQQRYYDPQVGRFLSIDAISASQSTGANFNRYWYADNRPYNFVDRDGRSSICTEVSPCGSGTFGGKLKNFTRSPGPFDCRNCDTAPSSSSTSTPPASTRAASNRFAGITEAVASVGNWIKKNSTWQAEAKAAFGTGATYKRNLLTGKDEAGIVLLGVGATGSPGARALAASEGLTPAGQWNLHLFRMGWNDPTNAPMTINLSADAGKVGGEVSFDGGGFDVSLSFDPFGGGAYAGAALMFDDTLVAD